MGLWSRLPNSHGGNTTEGDAPHCYTISQEAISRELQPTRPVVRPKGASQMGIFLTWWYHWRFSTESLCQKRGSINNLGKSRESWPWDSINGWDRFSPARRNRMIPAVCNFLFCRTSSAMRNDLERGTWMCLNKDNVHLEMFCFRKAKSLMQINTEA